jgi:hypothetical protein
VRLNVLTGPPLVLSRAPTLPTPCGYRLLTTLQFFHRAGMRTLVASANGVPITQAITTAATAVLAGLTCTFSELPATLRVPF